MNACFCLAAASDSWARVVAELERFDELNSVRDFFAVVARF